MPIAPTSTSRRIRGGAWLAISAAIQPPKPSPTSDTSLHPEIGQQPRVASPRCRADGASIAAAPTCPSRDGAAPAHRSCPPARRRTAAGPACRCRGAGSAAAGRCRRARDAACRRRSVCVVSVQATLMDFPLSFFVARGYSPVAELVQSVGPWPAVGQKRSALCHASAAECGALSPRLAPHTDIVRPQPAQRRVGLAFDLHRRVADAEAPAQLHRHVVQAPASRLVRKTRCAVSAVSVCSGPRCAGRAPRSRRAARPDSPAPRRAGRRPAPRPSPDRPSRAAAPQVPAMITTTIARLVSGSSHSQPVQRGSPAAAATTPSETSASAAICRNCAADVQIVAPGRA